MSTSTSISSSASYPLTNIEDLLKISDMFKAQVQDIQPKLDNYIHDTLDKESDQLVLEKAIKIFNATHSLLQDLAGDMYIASLHTNGRISYLNKEKSTGDRVKESK